MRTPTLIALTLAASTAAAGITNELIINGGFETGDFTGWTPFVQEGSSGDIFVTDLDLGESLPFSGNPGIDNGGHPLGLAIGPSSGQYYAAVDQSGPGAYSLEQTFTTSANATEFAISFDLFAGDASLQAPLNSGNFDYSGAPTQYLRVDLFNAAGALITNLIDATPLTLYMMVSQDLSAIMEAEQTYTLRLEHVDNMDNFHTALDSVSVSENVPAPSTLALLALAGIASRRHRD